MIEKVKLGSPQYKQTERLNSVIEYVNNNSNNEQISFVKGTQTAITGTWTGVASTLTELKDGQTIHYWLPYAGNGNATLNLTLKDGTTTGAKNCYYRGSTRLNTQFSAGSMITLTYRENAQFGENGVIYAPTGWWVDGVDDTDTDTKVRQANSTSNSDYRILLSASSGDTNQTSTVNKSSKFTANPSTGKLGATSFVENGTALSDKYVPKSSDEVTSITAEYGVTLFTNDHSSTIEVTQGEVLLGADAICLNGAIYQNGMNLDDKYALKSEIPSGGSCACEDSPIVSGTQTTATGTWTGVASKLTELKDGQSIRYWLPYNGSGNATLNLTLADGTTTGAINCYYKGTTRLSTQFSAGSMIELTYRKNITIGSGTTTYTGWWADGADNVSTYSVYQYSTTTDGVYPILFRYTAGNTSTSTYNGMTRYNNNFWFNPYSGIFHAPKLAENDELLEDKYSLKLYRHLIKIAYSDTNYSANATLTIISKDAGAYGLRDLNIFLAENGYLMTDSTLNSILTAEGYPAIGFSISNRSVYYMVKSVAFDKSVGGSFIVAVKSYNANITQSGNTLGLWISNISDAVTVI